jgi:transposase
VKVLHERVAGIDVHKDMIKVAIRAPGKKAWTRKTDILTFRTFYGVLAEMARELRSRGVTHVAMEASGIYTEPVYRALLDVGGFEEVLVVNAAHVKALKGHKTDALDSARIAELLECGLLRGSCIPPRELGEVRDLTRLRVKKVQARSSEVQRLAKTLETAGIKLGSVASDITGKGPTAMIEALIDGERRGAVMADLAIGRARTRDKMADLSMALEGRFTGHHAMMCRLHLEEIRACDAAIDGLDDRIGQLTVPWEREIALLKTIPGFGDIAARAWIAEIGPAPHQWFASHEKLASWVSLAPGNHVSAGKRRYGRTGNAGTWIKPVLVQCAWAAIRTTGRLQARYNRLVRRMGGASSPAARKKAIIAIAHTLLKIAYQVLASGTPYTEPGADFYDRRQDPGRQHDYLERRLRNLYPGHTVTITIAPDASPAAEQAGQEAAPAGSPPPAPGRPPAPGQSSARAPGHPPGPPGRTRRKPA